MKPPDIERPASPEQQQESLQEQLEHALEAPADIRAEVAKEQPRTAPASTAENGKSQTPPQGDPVMERVEAILEDGLAQEYGKMDEAARQEFKDQGEETALQVRSLLAEAKVQVHKIVQLIKQWLRLIPGVSQLFIDQEAKIKTDRLLHLRQEKEDE